MPEAIPVLTNPNLDFSLHHIDEFLTQVLIADPFMIGPGFDKHPECLQMLVPRLRGKGLADFRAEITRGISTSAEMLRDDGIDPTLLMFTLWTETIRDAVKEGQGNVIFLDAGTGSADSTLKNLVGFMGLGAQVTNGATNGSSGTSESATVTVNVDSGAPSSTPDASTP